MSVNEDLRNRILDDLSTQFSKDRLSLDDYERRVQAVQNANDDKQLLEVNLDIFPASRYQTPAYRNGSNLSPMESTQVAINYGSSPDRKELVAIFSESNLRGDFDAPKRIDAVSIFGGTQIDLRNATIPAEGITINSTAIFGGIDIIVPEGLALDVHGSGIFGGFSGPPPSRKQTGPLVRVVGAAIFGGVNVKTRSN